VLKSLLTKGNQNGSGNSGSGALADSLQGDIGHWSAQGTAIVARM